MHHEWLRCSHVNQPVADVHLSEAFEKPHGVPVRLMLAALYAIGINPTASVTRRRRHEVLDDLVQRWRFGFQPPSASCSLSPRYATSVFGHDRQPCAKAFSRIRWLTRSGWRAVYSLMVKAASVMAEDGKSLGAHGADDCFHVVDEGID